MAVAASLALPDPVRAVTYVNGFQGPFAPANWTAQPNGGSINTSGAPTSISLTSSNDGAGPDNTNFFIRSSATGTFSFDWTYTTSDRDGPLYDPFGYTINGNFTQLTNDSGPNTQSGSVTVTVNAGDVFGFRQRSTDSIFGSATTTIRNFRAPVPGPISALAVLPLAGMAAYRRRYKGLIKLS